MSLRRQRSPSRGRRQPQRGSARSAPMTRPTRALAPAPLQWSYPTRLACLTRKRQPRRKAVAFAVVTASRTAAAVAVAERGLSMNPESRQAQPAGMRTGDLAGVARLALDGATILPPASESAVHFETSALDFPGAVNVRPARKPLGR